MKMSSLCGMQRCHRLLRKTLLLSHAVPSNMNSATLLNRRVPQALITNNVLNTKYYSTYKLPRNTILLFVPQQEAWVVERMGKFYKTLSPGLNVLIPILDQVKYVQILKEQAIKIPEQSAITRDNVGLHIDGVLYVRVDDPYKASYGVENPEYAVTQLAQTTMRSEIGKLTLDAIFQEREALNINIVKAINHASEEPWGISCLRYEIRDIQVPERVQDAMQMQVAAERKKRAQILESEGQKEAAINVAQGQRESQILSSEAEKIEKINQAEGDAKAMLAKADAKARSIQLVAGSLSREFGSNAASLSVAEQYVSAFGNLAKEGNTILLPSNTGEVSNMVAQAMSIYKNLNTQPAIKGEGSGTENPQLLDDIKFDDVSEKDSKET
ncbi:stomatin-like protein stl-1 [Clavelina lepadiformis]|uniref:stomatin-like protein stl-1 n=1 Tax=Clavelina lepadiformis TaxID=159417 RepID=UPI0040417810